MTSDRMSRDEVLGWLQEDDPARLERLWAAADRTRAENVGPAVHLRGLVEISSHCVRQCGYCGLRAGNTALQRYRMNEDEILGCAHRAVALGYGTLVMQAGEDYGIEAPWLASIVQKIKSETPLAVTLSLGERPLEDLAAWRNAGADRYLLRFETSDRELYDLVHPPVGKRPSDRVAMLREIRELGYEAGSGIMVGIPGQTLASIADDILLFAELDLDMIGIGPYIPHPATPLGMADPTPVHAAAFSPSPGTPGEGRGGGRVRSPSFSLSPAEQPEGWTPNSPHPNPPPEYQGRGQEGRGRPLGRVGTAHHGQTAGDARPTRTQPIGWAPPTTPPADQAPNTELMVYKAVALTRLVCPQANIPSTTALATINRARGRELGLSRGANVVMPNLTPVKYRAMYEIYPGKACVNETAEACNGCLRGRIASIGRTIGSGPGGRIGRTEVPPVPSPAECEPCQSRLPPARALAVLRAPASEGTGGTHTPPVGALAALTGSTRGTHP